MYPDILEPEALELTEKLDFLKRFDFYLVGGNKLGIEPVVDLVYRKFGDSINYLPLLRGLIYFEDAERSKEELILLQDVGTWDTVKDYFIGHIKDFEKAFLQRKGFEL